LITSALAYELNHNRGEILGDWITIFNGYCEIIQILILSPVAILLSCGATIATFVLQKNNRTRYIFTFKWVLWTIISCLIAQAIIAGLKAGLPRERFICYIEGKPFEFKNWYELSWNPSIKDPALPTNSYQSFPSGHVNSACAIFAFVPIILTSIRSKYIKTVLLSSIIIFVVLVMFARLNNGNHYLTDTTWSVIINLVIYSSLYQAFKLIKINK
jgi:membrane-associated phospholipid phosphatase